jgi:hypothetical protein
MAYIRSIHQIRRSRVHKAKGKLSKVKQGLIKVERGANHLSLEPETQRSFRFLHVKQKLFINAPERVRGEADLQEAIFSRLYRPLCRRELKARGKERG